MMTTTLIYDDTFQCHDHLRRTVTVHLRLYRLATGALVAIATDLDQGPSVTNAAEDLATAVRRRFFRPGTALIWWEHYPRSNGDDDFDRVLFRWNGACYVEPTWQHGSKALVEEQLGMVFDASR
jgi:hypothetical protein